MDGKTGAHALRGLLFFPAGVKGFGDLFRSLPQGGEIFEKGFRILDADEAAEGQGGDNGALIVAHRHRDT